MAADTDTLAIVLIEMLEPYAGRVREPAAPRAVCSCSPKSFPKTEWEQRGKLFNP
jgi:hypothetical protein